MIFKDLKSLCEPTPLSGIKFGCCCVKSLCDWALGVGTGCPTGAYGLAYLKPSSAQLVL